MTSAVPLRRGLLLRYRVMALVTACLLIVLVFVGIPLQVAAHRPGVVNVVGTMHGFLYIVYLVTAFALTRRLGVPRGRMLLVLLAGTVPFCAFVAERAMTRRFEAAAPAASPPASRRAPARGEVRPRWLSPRALVLHAELLVVAPGCLAAGWWQATRALAGNSLSWVYSVEWPIFAVLAVWGWWHLVHEDPEAYRARRWRAQPRLDQAAPVPDVPTVATDVDAGTARWARGLLLASAAEVLVGFALLAVVPFGRPSGWIPARGGALYGVHASVGLVVGLAALAYVAWAQGRGRIARISAWTGAVCLGLGGLGGFLTEPHSAVRFLGVALMCIGPFLALAAYAIPLVLRARHAAAAAPRDPVSA